MEPTNSTGRCDPRAPLIVIGAGRSGSTLLMRMLDAHPALSFHGETGFLSARLWQLVCEERFWLDWKVSADKNPDQAWDLETSNEAEFQAQQERVADVLARTVMSILGARPDSTHWGFKEIWNGSAVHSYPWDAYDRLYPRATWLHLVRHPLEFAASCAAWNREELSDTYLESRLADWTAMVQCSVQRRDRVRYREVRYEDLVARPRECLAPVLADLGVDWSDACAAAVECKVLRSQRNGDNEHAVLKRYRRSRLLARAAASVGYDL